MRCCFIIEEHFGDSSCSKESEISSTIIDCNNCLNFGTLNPYSLYIGCGDINPVHLFNGTTCFNYENEIDEGEIGDCIELVKEFSYIKVKKVNQSLCDLTISSTDNSSIISDATYQSVTITLSEKDSNNSNINIVLNNNTLSIFNNISSFINTTITSSKLKITENSTFLLDDIISLNNSTNNTIGSILSVFNKTNITQSTNNETVLPTQYEFKNLTLNSNESIDSSYTENTSYSNFTITTNKSIDLEINNDNSTLTMLTELLNSISKLLNHSTEQYFNSSGFNKTENSKNNHTSSIIENPVLNYTTSFNITVNNTSILNETTNGSSNSTFNTSISVINSIQNETLMNNTNLKLNDTIIGLDNSSRTTNITKDFQSTVSIKSSNMIKENEKDSIEITKVKEKPLAIKNLNNNKITESDIEKESDSYWINYNDFNNPMDGKLIFSVVIGVIFSIFLLISIVYSLLKYQRDIRINKLYNNKIE